MDFRRTNCCWCKMRTNTIEDCAPCPKYLKYALGKKPVLDASAFCGVCVNRENKTLTVFCKTNRFYQQDSNEPFDCYNFCLETKEIK